MKAAVTEAFGGIDRVVVRDVPKPAPGPGEVLVRVRAASMNPLDCKLREGKFRFVFRVKPPFVLGFDVAGEVEAVGPGVTRLRPGDAVFGELPRPGAHAEYAVAGEDHLLPKPGRLSFEEAAAIPAAAMSALQACGTRHACARASACWSTGPAAGSAPSPCRSRRRGAPG